MSGSSSIRDTFFQECEDLIDALTDGLNEMADGVTDDETVNAVFRAVHSIKGAAGAFALTDLVGFAHKFETVLDEVRSHRLQAGPDLMRVLLRAGDILADLVDAARNEEPINEDAVATTLAALQEFLGEENEAEAEEEFVFEALAIDLGDEGSAETQIGFLIEFAPTAELYAVGQEPLFMFAELAELGAIMVAADRSNVPELLDDLDWEDSKLSWTVRLVTEASEQRIVQIFEFAEGLGTLDISPLMSGEVAETATFTSDIVVPEPATVAPNTPAPLPKSSVDAENNEQKKPNQMKSPAPLCVLTLKELIALSTPSES